jgi:hypothetical protein
MSGISDSWTVVAGALPAMGLIALAGRGGEPGERRLYAGALLAAAAVYLVPALTDGGAADIVVESAGVVLFGATALMALANGAVWLSVGWFLHAVWDIVRQTGPDPLLHAWYAQACLGFDLAIAAAILRRCVNASEARA